jgi:hypothetical protein
LGQASGEALDQILLDICSDAAYAGLTTSQIRYPFAIYNKRKLIFVLHIIIYSAHNHSGQNMTGQKMD